MKFVPLFVLSVSFTLVAAAQDGGDKAKLGEAVVAAQKAFDSGSLEQAEDLLRAVGGAVHDDFKAVMLRAKINYGLGEFGKASTYAQRAAELDPSNFDAHLLAGKALFNQAEQMKSDKRMSGTRVQGYYESALGEFEKLLKTKPNDPELLLWKAKSLFWLDRVPEAIAVYEALRKAKPDDPETCLHLAAAYRTTGNHEGAVKVLSEGLVTKGPSTMRGDLATQLFEILSQAGKQADLFPTFKAWSTAHPEDPQAWLWLGYVRFMEKNYDEAITHYQKGFDASGKKNGYLALEMGNALVQKGDLAKAAEWYGTALKLQPEWPNYQAGPVWKLNEVARAYVEKLDFAKGIETLEKHALPAGYEDRFTMNNLGLYYRDWADRGGKKSADGKSKNEKSLDYYLKASKLVLEDEAATPKEKAQVLNDTGVIYDYQLGNTEKGIEYYRQALQNDPKYGDALENLGYCFNKLGKYEEAIPLFQKVLEQEPGRQKSQRGLAEAKKAVEKDQKPTSR